MRSFAPIRPHVRAPAEQAAIKQAIEEFKVPTTNRAGSSLGRGIEVAGRKAAATRHTCASLPTGLPHGLPRCGEVWALREDCEAYTRSKVIGCALPAKFTIKVICYSYSRPANHSYPPLGPSGHSTEFARFHRSVWPWR